MASNLLTFLNIILDKTPGKMKPNLEPWKTDLEQTFVTLTTIKTYVEPWQTNLEQWKDNENQPRTDKNHKNPLGTMKNQTWNGEKQ